MDGNSETDPQRMTETYTHAAFGQQSIWRQAQRLWAYDALSRKDLHGFFVQLVVFCIIAGALLVLNARETGKTLLFRAIAGRWPWGSTFPSYWGVIIAALP